MSQRLTLSVVDQSPVRAGSTAGQALKETIELAAATEALGYERYWVAEHHNIANFAGTSPETLIGQIAARTSTIRVGERRSDAVALQRLQGGRGPSVCWSRFYPGRIDLGIGRAPGSDQLTAAALAYPGQPRQIHHFPQQVCDLLGYLSDSVETGHPFAEVTAGPGTSTVPDVWLLGSRYESALMAAQLGLPFAYAHFFGIGVEEGPPIVEGYRRNFMPSVYLSEPKVNVAVQVLCADTLEEALRLASSRNLARLTSILGTAKGIPNVEEALSYPYQRKRVGLRGAVTAAYALMATPSR